MFSAYCYSEGDVHFGALPIPDGAILVLKGPEQNVKQIIAAECVLGRFQDGAHPMIESVNYASKSDDWEAHVDALTDFKRRLEQDYKNANVATR